MKKLLVLLALVTACATASPAVGKERMSPVGRAFHATVELQTEEERTFCSGVIVEDVILTAWHCVEDGETVFVKTIEGRFEAALSDFDMVADLAVLLPADGRALPKGVKLARKAPGFADEVWLIGHALGEYDYSITKGIVSHPNREDGLYGGSWMQHDAGQIGGNSGGPVLNKRGQLVGIVSFTIIYPTYCSGICLDTRYTSTHIHGAVHYDPIRSLLR